MRTLLIPLHADFSQEQVAQEEGQGQGQGVFGSDFQSGIAAQIAGGVMSKIQSAQILDRPNILIRSSKAQQTKQRVFSIYTEI